jgi:hypothetical protein
MPDRCVMATAGGTGTNADVMIGQWLKLPKYERDAHLADVHQRTPAAPRHDRAAISGDRVGFTARLR